MNTVISKKILFLSFLFINFIQPSKSADLEKIGKSKNHLPDKLIWSKISGSNIEPNIANFSIKNKFDLISLN